MSESVSRDDVSCVMGVSWVVAFLTATGMFIFTTSFPVTPTRSHDHPQLGSITPTDGRVKCVS